jgi:hypothetical protein
VCSAGDQAPPQASLRPASAAAVSPASEDKLRAAFDHLYNWNSLTPFTSSNR